MRHLLLWAARNSFLRNRIPRLWFARRAVRRFMPGEQLDDALAAADRFQADGIGTLFTHLGENVTDMAEADAVAAHYLDVLSRIKERGIDGEISTKLTQLGLDLDEAAAERHMVTLIERARELGGGTVWIDMEGSAYTEPTVAMYERLRAAHDNVGIALQAYLRRTAADIARLMPLEPTIRLVKGAYDEPAAIAFRKRSEVDANYLAQAAVILLEGRGKPKARLALGTHDVGLIEQIGAYAEAAGIGRDAYEIQMLYGIREDQQRRLARAGYRVIDLIAYGEFWYPWYVRRLAERPANVTFVLRQLLPW
jgi:proline dehydrogenase